MDAAGAGAASTSQVVMEVPVVDQEPIEAGSGLQGVAQERGFVDLIEEYALLGLLAVVVALFLFRKARQGVEQAVFLAQQGKREASMRQIRELQQARYEVDTAQRRDELEAAAELKRKQKLENMQAMTEGRSAKDLSDDGKPKKPRNMREYWDNVNGMNHGSGEGGGRFRPTQRRRG
mmetsp:Transcript_48726/g.76084  ORF Transcript_48726/g.76084 Transcript_48726/m.76084 type:complete len:177 (-) Transcript_48726:1539-2069(-)|eukprot:CAMPEP_0184294474 /NCGR_PEP_ID=MMETSP1049-20130417/5658_1 /TAXON_ID=77928 /ORGANISM="Proteomonas sulcata, Strain CCMP704" /LENGTH=176 /DNA_ID=CAMNT_0026602773 /DNA_START=96 /DNA_END=626 /DNA_ORIENTATION=-